MRLVARYDNFLHLSRTYPWAGVKAQVHLTPRMGTYTGHRRIQMAQNGGQKTLRVSFRVRRERRVILVGANPTQQLSLRLVAARAAYGGNNVS